jgi:hypothetical protein
VPWAQAANEDGTFKSPKELEKLYLKQCGLKRRTKTIAYCRIGERSSHTWFVLKYLLGFQQVKNYDGSWTEWGNLVGAPIEKGPGRQSVAAEKSPQRSLLEQSGEAEPEPVKSDSPSDAAESSTSEAREESGANV